MQHLEQANRPVENTIPRFINRHKQVTELVKRVTKTVTTKEINHEDVIYNDKHYVVCCIPFNDEYKMFIVDGDDKLKILNKGWCYRSEGGYVSCNYYVEDVQKDLYLHNFIMNKLTFEGKGQQQTIDHINRIGTDNRKSNLREVSSQSAQNFNQKRRERTTELPPDCGITVDQFPKNIYYGGPNDGHGDFFYIEIRGVSALTNENNIKHKYYNNSKYVWRSTKSKKSTLKLKLQETIDQLLYLKKKYPELKDIIIDNTTEEKRGQLTYEYNEILKLSHYPIEVVNANIQKFKSEITDLNIIKKNNEPITKPIIESITEQTNPIIENQEDLQPVLRKVKKTDKKPITELTDPIIENQEDFKPITHKVKKLKPTTEPNIEPIIEPKIDSIIVSKEELKNVDNKMETTEKNQKTELEQLEILKKIKATGRKSDNLLVLLEYGINPEDVPKYCHFQKASEKRGCKFIIDRHPKLIEREGRRTWSTKETKSMSVKEKFNELIKKLEELNS